MVDSEMKVTGVLGKRRLLDPGAEGTERRQAFAAEGSGGEGGWGRDDQRRLDPWALTFAGSLPPAASVSRSVNGPDAGRRSESGARGLSC